MRDREQAGPGLRAPKRRNPVIGSGRTPGSGVSLVSRGPHGSAQVSFWQRGSLPSPLRPGSQAPLALKEEEFLNLRDGNLCTCSGQRYGKGNPVAGQESTCFPSLRSENMARRSGQLLRQTCCRFQRIKRLTWSSSTTAKVVGRNKTQPGQSRNFE